MTRTAGNSELRCIVAAALVVSIGSTLGAPRRAWAEDAPASLARQLFLDGRKLASEGKYKEACPKFEESLRLEVGVGTQFNLADCWEHIGRTASARSLFLGAAAVAKGAGQTEREQVLRDRAAGLETRLTRLVIEVKDTDPKLVVKRDDMPLDKSSWGQAEPVDPAKYRVVARAPGKKDWEKVVEVTPTTPVVTVEVPVLEPAEAKKPAPEPKESEAKPALKPSKPAPSEAQSDRAPSYMNYRALAVGGFGIVSIGVGAVMGFKYLGANGDAKDICPSSHDCSIKQIQDHDRLVQDAKTDRRWAFAGFGVGAAALVGAGALWILQKPHATPAKTAWQAAPVLGPGVAGAALSGAF